MQRWDGWYVTRSENTGARQLAARRPDQDICKLNGRGIGEESWVGIFHLVKLRNDCLLDTVHAVPNGRYGSSAGGI